MLHIRGNHGADSVGDGGAVPNRRRRHTRGFRAKFGLVGTAVTVVAATLAMSAAPASAARSNNRTKPVLFIHGYDPGGGGHDCNTYWGPAMTDLANQGYNRATMRTWGYYSNDRNCYYTWGGTRASSLDEVSKALAWSIFNAYTSQAKVIDVVAHSMGGLIIRKAISAVQRHEPGYPGWLYVEDVVTLATPHGSIATGWGCVAITILSTRQCLDVATFSPFMNSLVADAPNPQGANGGTDWSVIGSTADNLPLNTPLDMKAGHKYMFDQLDHTSIIKVPSTSAQRFKVQWAHVWPTVRSGTTYGERSALYVTGQALESDGW